MATVAAEASALAEQAAAEAPLSAAQVGAIRREAEGVARRGMFAPNRTPPWRHTTPRREFNLLG